MSKGRPKRQPKKVVRHADLQGGNCLWGVILGILGLERAASNQLNSKALSSIGVDVLPEGIPRGTVQQKLLCLAAFRGFYGIFAVFAGFFLPSSNPHGRPSGGGDP